MLQETAVTLQETVVTTALRLNFELNVQRHILNFEFSLVTIVSRRHRHQMSRLPSRHQWSLLR